MQHFRKIFYVVNPTVPSQPALGRVIDGAKRSLANLHLYVCIPPATLPCDDPKTLRQAEIARYQLWLDKLVQPARDIDVPVTTEVEISDDWRAATAYAAERYGADLIVKVTHPRTMFRRRLQKTSDWMLLRNANCPIFFVKKDRPTVPRNLVAAIDAPDRDEAHMRLTEEVIRHTRGIAEVTGAAIHAVHAHSDLLHFVHPPDLAKQVGIERKRVHVGELAPEDLLLKVARSLADPIVIIGSSSRRKLSTAVLGNTAERILDKIPFDILVVIMPTEQTSGSPVKRQRAPRSRTSSP